MLTDLLDVEIVKIVLKLKKKNSWTINTIKRFYHNCPNVKKVIMWTLGTSLKGTKKNRIKARGYWKKFRKEMSRLKLKKNEHWNPLLHVLEAGSRGDRLHFHIIVDGVTHHKTVLKLWRSITKEESNIEYSYPKKCNNCKTLNRDNRSRCIKCNSHLLIEGRKGKGHFIRLRPNKAIKYLVKYLNKDKRNYYYMGSMLKKFVNIKIDTCRVLKQDGFICSSGIEYYSFHNPECDSDYHDETCHKITYPMFPSDHIDEPSDPLEPECYICYEPIRKKQFKTHYHSELAHVSCVRLRFVNIKGNN